MYRSPLALIAAVVAASGLALTAVSVTGASASSLATASAAVVPAPTPGAPGVGDRLFPLLGNGGYKVLHYTLSLRYEANKPTQGIVGTVLMTAVAHQSLSKFHLDYSGKTVGKVAVNGKVAGFSRRPGGELIVFPSKPIALGAHFTIQVTGFTAKPTHPGDTDPTYAFFITTEGSATAGQPEVMHYFYPSNDHPSNKSTFTFKLNVPKGETAVANGVLTSKHTVGKRTTWTYQQTQPMATELTQVAVGNFTVVQRGKVGKVAVRDVVPNRLLPTYKKLLAVEKSHLTWMEHRVGAYPFNTYGTLVVRAPLGFALETQTLSLFDTTWFTDYPVSVWSPAMLHELAHQWFGDSVAPKTWSDIWLNEGHASWYEFTYAAQNNYLSDDEYQFHTNDYVTLMKDLYALGDQYRADNGPVALPVDANHLFNPNVYEGGALALYALREKIGVPAFAKVEQAWVTTYQGRSASTNDFIALASKVSGQDLTAYLNAWLYGTTTPPMPHHPDWTVNPVVTPSPAAAKSAAPLPLLARPRPRL